MTMKMSMFCSMAMLSLFLVSPGLSQADLQTRLQILMDKEQHMKALEDSAVLIRKNMAELNDQMSEYKNRLQDIQAKKSALHREILDMKAAIYEAQQAEPIWVEGEAEIILDEQKPYEQNKRLLQMLARRDAMEKGGKLIIETLTTLKTFEVSAEEGSGMAYKLVEEFRSIIQSKGKVQVIDQDVSGDYDKVLMVEEGGLKKLKTRVRLKISSIDEINPFKEELKNSN